MQLARRRHCAAVDDGGLVRARSPCGGPGAVLSWVGGKCLIQFNVRDAMALETCSCRGVESKDR